MEQSRNSAVVGPAGVLVTSFSRAAAAELAGRDLPISSDRVGTLHSHCWHALGGPEIAEANVEDWNKEHPSVALTPQKRQGRLDGEETADDEAAKGGDALLERVSRCRGMMLPKQDELTRHVQRKRGGKVVEIKKKETAA